MKEYNLKKKLLMLNLNSVNKNKEMFMDEKDEIKPLNNIHFEIIMFFYLVFHLLNQMYNIYKMVKIIII
jgi:hypothetical protein